MSCQRLFSCKLLKQKRLCYHKRLLEIESERWYSDACYFYDSTAFGSPCQHDKHLKSCEHLIRRSWLHCVAWRSLSTIVLVTAPCRRPTTIFQRNYLWHKCAVVSNKPPFQTAREKTKSNQSRKLQVLENEGGIFHQTLY